MKALKVVAIVLLSLLGACAILIAVALIPAVQTWAVRRAVEGQPGMKLEVAKVDVGFTSARISDLRLVRNGIVVTADQVRAEYSALDYLTGSRLTVHDLGVDDLQIDARAMTPTPDQPEPEEPAEPFRGILNQLKLPFDLQIARFHLPAEVLLPHERTARVDLRGSDITTGKRGTVDWKIVLRTPDAPNGVTALHTSGTAAVHITTERRIDTAEVNAVASAEGANIPSDQVKLEARLEQPAAGGNEGYNAIVTLLRGSATHQLVTLAGQYDTNANEISGAWKISARTDQLAGLLRGMGLPDTAVNGSGTFALEPDTGSGNTTGELVSVISELRQLSPQLAPMGAVTLRTRFDGALSENTARLDQFAVEVTTANGRKLAQINALQPVAYSLDKGKVTLANPQTDVAQVRIEALPLAWAQPFLEGMSVESGELSLVMAVASDATGSQLRATPVEPLTLKNVTLRRHGQPVVEQLTLSARPRAELADDRLRAEIGELSVTTAAGDRLTGRATAEIAEVSSADRRITFAADVNAEAMALLKPHLPADSGPVAASVTTEGALQGARLSISKATAEVVPRGQAPLVTVIIPQPIEVNLETMAISSAQPADPTAHVRLGRVPLAWAQPFVPESQLSGQITGGEIAITARSMDDLTATTTAPISLERATLGVGGKPLIQAVDLTADFSAGKQGQTLRYDIRRLEARQGPAELLKLVASGELRAGDKPALTAKGNLDANLAAVLQQPVAAGATTLTHGTLSATFDAAIAESVRANASLRAQNLIAKATNRSLGLAELTVAATVQPDGSSVIKAPFTLTNGNRRSDLTLEGTLGGTENARRFEGKVASTHLFTDDLQALVSLAPKSDDDLRDETARSRPPVPNPTAGAPAPRPRGPAGPDVTPFWAGTTGNVAISLAEVTYGRDYLITNVQGTATISEQKLAVGPLQGLAGGKPFQLNLAITFTPGQPQPYALASDTSISEFDVGAFLRSANPNQPPELETVVNVEAHLRGDGATLGNLLKNTHGSFAFNGGQGVLRALGKKGQLLSNVGALAGLAGSLTGNNEKLAVATEIAQRLAAIPFERFTMKMERGEDLKLRIGLIEFLAPEIHLLGRGELANQPGVSVQHQPMNITFQLGAKGLLADLMNRLPGLLSNTTDELGFQTLATNFKVGGTPAKTDADSLYRVILDAAVKTGLGGLMDRLNRP